MGMVILNTAVLALALAAGAGSTHPLMEGDAGRANVTTANPADMAESRTYNPRREGPSIWLDPLVKHLDKRLEEQLADGQRMEVTIVNVLRAGRFEPWHGPGWNEVRILRDHTPPRIELEYRYYGVDGQLRAEGHERLVDGAYAMRSIRSESDPSRHEKRMLDDWVRRTLVDGKGGTP